METTRLAFGAFVVVQRFVSAWTRRFLRCEVFGRGAARRFEFFVPDQAPCTMHGADGRWIALPDRERVGREKTF